MWGFNNPQHGVNQPKAPGQFNMIVLFQLSLHSFDCEVNETQFMLLVTYNLKL